MPPALSEAEKLRTQWHDFRVNSSTFYDVLLWRNTKWPPLSMAWLPASWQQPPAVAAAQHDASLLRAAEHAAAAAAAVTHTQQQQQRQQQAVPMPVEHHYLLQGEQTSGAGASRVLLTRVEVAGQLRQEGFDARAHRVVMQRGQMSHVMHVPHGRLDVNRLAVMPSDANIIATCCDQPEVYVFDLRKQPVVPEATDAQLAAAGRAADDEDSSAWDDGGGGDNDAGLAGGARASSDVDMRDADDATDSPSSSGSDADDDDDEGGGSDASAGRLAPPHPQAVLEGRLSGGFGLEFNPTRPWVLLGADLRGGVQLWDVQAYTSSTGSGGSGGGGSQDAPPRIQPLQAVPSFVRAHDGQPCGVNDVSWHAGGTTYALATESGQVWVQDLRSPAAAGSPSGSGGGRHGLGAFRGSGAAAPQVAAVHVRRTGRREQQHAGQQQQRQQQQDTTAPDCLCVAFDPCHEHRLASGGADGYAAVLDLRRLGEPLEQLSLHAGAVTSVAWSPKQPGLLLTAGEDGVVLLWDAGKMRHAAAARERRQQRQQEQQQQQDGGPPPAPPHRPPQGRQGVDDQVAMLGQQGLVWAHGGHLSAVSAAALHPDRPWLVASASAEEVVAPGASGRPVCVQRRHCMVWEVNRSGFAAAA